MNRGSSFRPPVLEIRGLSKTFPGTVALRDVSLEVRPDEIHALVGANGSGKSTLIKTLSGYHRADPGVTAWFNGEPFDMAAVSDERHDRLRFVHQHLGLVLELGVMDNLALHHDFLRGRFGNIDWRGQARAARGLLRRFDLSMDLYRPLSDFTPVERVVVAIVAALQGWEGGSGVLVLDEPTAVLPPHEVERLFEMIAEVRRTGTSVLYVSHRLDEIFQIGDRVSVLRGGELVASDDVSNLTPSKLATLMVGEDVDADYRADVPSAPGPDIALEATGLTGRYLRGAEITIRKGEIVGLAGLPGSGREELPYILAGALGRGAGGRIRGFSGSGEWMDVASAKLDLPLVPADRASEAIVSEFTVTENLSLPLLDRLKGRLALSRLRESALVDEWILRLKVRTARADAPIATLSGGNQQKVVIARCLAMDPPVLLLCEPTAGVDIGTRIAIYDLIAEQAKRGLGVVVSSTDISDLLGMCTRVLVLIDGLVVSELAKDELSQSALLQAMEGSQG
jgi:ABC-type sugar transport system ATPase subunit